MGELPKCPLCGAQIIGFPEEPEAWPHHPEANCTGEGVIMPESLWRRVAAPLAPEVVAVLEAISRVHIVDPTTFEIDPGDEAWPHIVRFYQASSAWIAAGRPGLPEKE